MKKPLVLWGGVDIDPYYYNETRGKYTQYSDNVKDAYEFKLARVAIANKQPIVGVCRGAQLLCVLNSGSLYQHTVPKKQSHGIKVLSGAEQIGTDYYDNGNYFNSVSAGHHQVMKPKGDFILYGWNPEPIEIYDEQLNCYFEVKDTAEIVYYPETKCLAVQPHPEWEKENTPFNQWLNKLMKELEIDYAF